MKSLGKYIHEVKTLMSIRVLKLKLATPLLKQLHWLPVVQRIQFKTLVHTYNCVNNLAPTYLSELIETHIPSRSTRSSSEHQLKECLPVNSYGHRSFRIAAPFLWNRLPQSVKSAETVTHFKQLLKTHLFIQYYQL